MLVTSLLLEENDSHTVGRGSYQNIYIAFYCNVLYPVLLFSFMIMDAVGEAT